VSFGWIESYHLGRVPSTAQGVVRTIGALEARRHAGASGNDDIRGMWLAKVGLMGVAFKHPQQCGWMVFHSENAEITISRPMREEVAAGTVDVNWDETDVREGNACSLLKNR
jgi:hypothetical protein